MREIDTQALEAVARSLGVGNPATAVAPVVFDDDNLQQSFDVERLIAYRAARAGVESEGWAVYSQTLSMLTGIGFYSTSMPILSSAPAEAEGYTFWVYQLGVLVEAAAAIGDFDNCHVVALLPDEARIGTGGLQSILLWAGSTIFQRSADDGWVRDDVKSITSGSPFPLVPGGVTDGQLQLRAELDGAAGNVDATLVAVGRFLPPGVPPTNL